jgi:Protein of unknown function (DUF1385)
MSEEFSEALENKRILVGTSHTPRAPAANRRVAPQVLPRMGGIALKNGLVLVSEEHWAAAIREGDGGISVASGPKTRLPSGRSWAGSGARGDGVGGRSGMSRLPAPSTSAQTGDMQGLPMLRGLARFAETLLVVAQVKVRMPHAELPLEGGRVAVALATAFAATSTVRAVGPKSGIAQETGAVLATFLPAVLSLRNSSISGYHGAEHKVIAGREAELRTQIAARTRYPRTGSGPVSRGSNGPSAGSLPTGSAAASAPKEHDRCGSNLVGPLLFTTIAVNALIRGKSGRMSPVGSVVAGAVSLGAALEALRWATRHGDSLAARVLLSPGRIIQKTLTTSEPSSDQLEVAQRAMEELLRVEA